MIMIMIPIIACCMEPSNTLPPRLPPMLASLKCIMDALIVSMQCVSIYQPFPVFVAIHQLLPLFPLSLHCVLALPCLRGSHHTHSPTPPSSLPDHHFGTDTTTEGVPALHSMRHATYALAPYTKPAIHLTSRALHAVPGLGCRTPNYSERSHSQSGPKARISKRNPSRKRNEICNKRIAPEDLPPSLTRVTSSCCRFGCVG